jgi:hypothetical protein
VDGGDKEEGFESLSWWVWMREDEGDHTGLDSLYAAIEFLKKTALQVIYLVSIHNEINLSHLRMEK